LSIRYDGRVAIVTGAGNGLGRSHALALAARGAKVVVNDLGGARDGTGASLSAAETVVKEITDNGGEAIANGANVTKDAEVADMVAAAMTKWGRVDILVNNAGILRDKTFAKMEMPDFRIVIDVHLVGTAVCTKAVWEIMRERQYGRIVCTSSPSGLYGIFGQANYGAAKAGIAALSRALAFDMQRYNVRSNAIAPFAWSRMVGTTIDESSPEAKARAEKLARAMPPSKIAPLAVFLASDLAAAVTGQVFAVRGNELFLMSQHRPIRSAYSAQGWTPELIASQVAPAFASNFTPLENSRQVFSWDPV
jgi:NAD(P)-dependent dehydrogenase (short-subunit alcohol dehydrogenase family)